MPESEILGLLSDAPPVPSGGATETQRAAAQRLRKAQKRSKKTNEGAHKPDEVAATAPSTTRRQGSSGQKHSRRGRDKHIDVAILDTIDEARQEPPTTAGATRPGGEDERQVVARRGPTTKQQRRFDKLRQDIAVAQTELLQMQRRREGREQLAADIRDVKRAIASKASADIDAACASLDLLEAELAAADAAASNKPAQQVAAGTGSPGSASRRVGGAHLRDAVTAFEEHLRATTTTVAARTGEQQQQQPQQQQSPSGGPRAGRRAGIPAAEAGQPSDVTTAQGDANGVSLPDEGGEEGAKLLVVPDWLDGSDVDDERAPAANGVVAGLGGLRVAPALSAPDSQETMALVQSVLELLQRQAAAAAAMLEEPPQESVEPQGVAAAAGASDTLAAPNADDDYADDAFEVDTAADEQEEDNAEKPCKVMPSS